MIVMELKEVEEEVKKYEKVENKNHHLHIVDDVDNDIVLVVVLVDVAKKEAIKVEKLEEVLY